MINPEEYLYELSKFVDSESILIVCPDGKLVRVYCPFPVILVIEVGDLVVGNLYYVDAVKVSKELFDLYLISGKGYLIRFFKIKI